MIPNVMSLAVVLLSNQERMAFQNQEDPYATSEKATFEPPFESFVSFPKTCF
jgi:hypothetical protein